MDGERSQSELENILECKYTRNLEVSFFHWTSVLIVCVVLVRPRHRKRPPLQPTALRPESGPPINPAHSTHIPASPHQAVLKYMLFQKENRNPNQYSLQGHNHQHLISTESTPLSGCGVGRGGYVEHNISAYSLYALAIKSFLFCTRLLVFVCTFLLSAVFQRFHVAYGLLTKMVTFSFSGVKITIKDRVWICHHLLLCSKTMQ